LLAYLLTEFVKWVFADHQAVEVLSAEF